VKGGWDCLGFAALRRNYRCADDWIAIACASEAQAAGLARVLGLELADLAMSLTERRDGPLAQALEAAFARRDRAEVLAALHDAGAPAAAVVRSLEVFENDWLWAEGYLERWEHPVRGPVISARGYGEFSRSACAFDRPSPLLAQHSSAVLRDYGFSENRIADLIACGAATDDPG